MIYTVSSVIYNTHVNLPDYQTTMHIGPGLRSHHEFHAWVQRSYPVVWPTDDANPVA